MLVELVLPFIREMVNDNLPPVTSIGFRSAQILSNLSSLDHCSSLESLNSTTWLRIIEATEDEALSLARRQSLFDVVVVVVVVFSSSSVVQATNAWKTFHRVALTGVGSDALSTSCP